MSISFYSSRASLAHGVQPIPAQSEQINANESKACVRSGVTFQSTGSADTTLTSGKGGCPQGPEGIAQLHTVVYPRVLSQVPHDHGAMHRPSKQQECFIRAEAAACDLQGNTPGPDAGQESTGLTAARSAHATPAPVHLPRETSPGSCHWEAARHSGTQIPAHR